MDKCITFINTNKYLYCEVTTDTENNSTPSIKLRSDNSEIQNRLKIKSKIFKNNIEACRIMAGILAKSLNKDTIYNFKCLQKKYKYHGKVKAFLEELTALSVLIKPLKS